eukprot:s6748_g7.t1
MLGPNLHTTYGWELRNLETRGGRRDIFYQGYMRVILGAKDEVLANSGRRGYFFEALAKDMMEKFPVKWEEPIEGETDASYFQRVRELAETGKKPARAVAAASGCDCRTVKKCRSLPAHTGAMVCPICGATRMLPFRKGEWRIYATPPTTDLAQFIQGDADLIVTAARCTGNRKPEKEVNTRWRPEKPSGHGFGFGRSLGFGPLRTSSPGPAKAMDEDGGENAEHMDVEPPSGEGKAEKAAGTGKRHSPTDGKSQTNSGKKTKAEDIDP